MEGKNVLQLLDYCILIGMMLISIGIGIYYAFSGGRQRTTKEYFIGNKNMGIIPVTLSLCATFFSTNTFLGTPAEVYAFGYYWWYCLIGGVLSLPFVAYCIMPVFYNLGATSTYEYLEKRFDRRVRRTASFFFLLYLCLYVAFVTYGPALALNQVTNLNFWGSVVTMCIIGTIYTTIGGIKAVMWTDSLQMIIIFISMIFIVIKGVMEIGVTELITRNIEGQRISPISFSLDPRIRYSFWGTILFSFLIWSGNYGVSQYQVQRYLSSPTIQNARRSLWYNAPGQITVLSLVCLIGLLIYAKYWNCDPIITNKIEALDQIFPFYVMDTFGGTPGLPGLFVAGIFSGSLSTTSSVLNCIAVVVLDDYIKSWNRWSNISDEKATVIAKLIGTFFGIFTIFMVYIVSIVGGNILQATGTILGAASGTAYGIFFAGLFCPWIPPMGAFIGMLTGFAVSLWLGLGISLSNASALQKLPVSGACLNSSVNFDNGTLSSSNNPDLSDIPEVYKISYIWNYIICIMIIAVVGSAFGIFRRDYKYDRRLYSPLVNYIHDKIWKTSKEEDFINTSYSTCPTKEELLMKEQIS